jgi:D-alanyl-D-alanine carboxypeptidase
VSKKSGKIIFLILLFIAGAVLVYYSNIALQEQNARHAAEEKLKAEELAQKEAEKKALEEKEKVYLLGKFEPSKREDFAPVPSQYNFAGYKIYLRKETLAAFIKMAEAAKKENVDLLLVSADRNFAYQKDIWDKKWEGITLVDGKKLPESIPNGLERFKKILEYSAVPSTSRHHWGTDIDINMTVPYYFQTEAGKKVYAWLVKNAASFGFCQPYTEKGPARPTGYNEEKWHWSYLPLAKDFTQRYKTLITAGDIKGFDGDEYVKSINLIDDYVLGINPACL